MANVSRWNTGVVFPNDNYLIRCTKASFGPSSKGSPMITLEHEILSPETVNVAGEEFSVVGQFIGKTYIVTKSVDENGNVDADKTEKIKKRLDDLCTKYGVPAIENPDNPDVSVFEGKVVFAYLEDSPSEKRKAPTKEQLERGEKLGEILTNPLTGEPLVTHYPKIGQINGAIGVYGVPAESVIKQALAGRQ